MAKLKDDEIRWVLSLDAKGVQGELRTLSSATERLKNDNKSLKDEMKAASKALDESEKAMVRLEEAGKKTTKEYRYAKESFTSNSAAVAELKKQIEANTKSIDANRAKQTELVKTMKLEDMTMSQLRQRANELQKQLNGTSLAAEPAAYKQLSSELSVTRKRMDELKKGAQAVDSALGKMSGRKGAMSVFLGNIYTAGLLMGLNALKNAFKNAYNLIKNFQQANADLAAVLGKVRTEIKVLTDDALLLGKTTEYTASQVTSLQTELAKLGFDESQILNMTKYVLSFATATGSDLPSAATLAGSALRMFGLQSIEAERVVSTMAVATTKSALSFSFLQSAMSTVGPVAKAFGFSIEETVSLLGALANAGFDASSAATASRNILLNLADSSGKLAKALGQPIKSLDDLVPALIKLRESGIDLNSTLELTDKRSVAAFNTFLSGAESLTTLRDAITDAGDAMQDMVNEKLNTVEGSTKMLQSAWEGLLLSFSNSAGPIKWVIDQLTELVTWINRAVSATGKMQDFEDYRNLLEEEKSGWTEEYAKRFKDNRENGVLTVHEFYEEAKKENAEYMKELEAGMEKFMEDRRKSIAAGIISEDEWSKSDKLFADSQQYRIDQLKKVQEALEEVYGGLTVLTPGHLTPGPSPQGEGRKKGGSTGKTGVKGDRFAAEERGLNAEINLLKKKRLEGVLTEKEYNSEVERLTIASYSRRLSVQGLKEDERIQISGKLYDMQLKQQERSDAEVLAAMKKERDRQLQLLETTRNEKLQMLQEEESDRSLYSLRASEIEAQAATARKEVIEAFGEQLRKAELQNEKTRLDAVEENGREAVKAEGDALKSREKQTRLFQKTTADFERQYHIRTLEERISDEKRIVEKQHAAGVLSEEAYQIALSAIERKYSDERLKAREQYGLVGMQELQAAELDAARKQYEEKLLSEEDYRKAVAAIDKRYEDEKAKVREQYNLVNMRELYDAELEALKLQYEQKLLTDEEYERAKFEMKLKYANDLFKQEQELAQVGADAVKAAEEVATAQVSAEYAKRESALTEQYNAGIMSQEQYNAEKERLDYEQRVEELNIQKKYADANFAMQASQIIATGAMAAIQAFSAMAAIPIVGPALGAVAAGLVAVTTALQLAKAKAERDRIKALTLESPGSSGGTAAKTGVIALKSGFAEGGSNIQPPKSPSRGTFFSAGGYTGDGEKYEVMGFLPVHGGEYVVDKESLRYPDVADKVRSIERVRRLHSDENPLPAGFAEGGSNTSTSPPAPLQRRGGEYGYGLDEGTVRQLTEVLRRLVEGDITVNYGITELEAQQRRKMEVEGRFSG
jgi:TP901 family phage tail tape measure protein